MIDARCDYINISPMQRLAFVEEASIFRSRFNAVCYLPVRALDAVAKTDRPNGAVMIAGPGIHCHRICVIHEQDVGFGYRANFPAELEKRGFVRCAYMIPPAQSVSPTHWSDSVL